MFKLIIFKLGFISIKDVEDEIEKLSKKIYDTAPTSTWRDNTKNTMFHKERNLMNKFIEDLYKLKIDLKYPKINKN
jgi:hypothetical protein